MMREQPRNVGRSLDALDVVTHEMRTPLSILSMTLATMRDRFPTLDEAQREEFLDSLTRQVNRLDETLGRLGALRDMQHQQVPMVLAPVDMGQAVRDIVANMAQLDASIEMEVTNTTDCPMAVADQTSVQQILFQVLTNAVRYGEGQPVTVSLASENGCIEVRVRDHGTGVAPDDITGIFAPYTRGGLPGPGLGIGLTLGRGLAQAQGGNLEYFPPPSGKGSIFVLSLPRALSPPIRDGSDHAQLDLADR